MEQELVRVPMEITVIIVTIITIVVFLLIILILFLNLILIHLAFVWLPDLLLKAGMRNSVQNSLSGRAT